MGALSAALHDAAVAAGADVRTGVEVTAVGDGEVRFQDRTAAESSVGARWTLANVAPAELDRLRGRASRRIRPREGSQLKVNLLLTRLPRLRDAHDHHRGPRSPAPSTSTRPPSSSPPRTPRPRPGGSRPCAPCEAYCHTLSDAGILGPELAAAGAQTMTLFGLHMPARLFDADPAGARRAALDCHAAIAGLGAGRADRGLRHARGRRHAVHRGAHHRGPRARAAHAPWQHLPRRPRLAVRRGPRRDRPLGGRDRRPGDPRLRRRRAPGRRGERHRRPQRGDGRALRRR